MSNGSVSAVPNSVSVHSTCRRRRIVGRALCAIALLAWCGVTAAVEDAQLGKYQTHDAVSVGYRAIVTPGREHAQLLPLIVFLHGDWQDGTDNESQLAGYGNGSLELVDAAIHDGIPLV
ncbi:MAG TPA: hypothetical protein VFN13_07830, partial [Rudaea sp.]|nr:hypothetical protein [Rudaea sp.]